MDIIYDNQERDYNNSKSTDLDNVLYSKKLIDSPNRNIGKFIVIDVAQYKNGNFKSFEELLLVWPNEESYNIILATEYCTPLEGILEEYETYNESQLNVLENQSSEC